MKLPLRILHLEDDPLDTELVLELLRADGLEVELERVSTLPAFEQALRRECYALVLSDYTLPGVNPLEALRLARLLCPETAIIFVSGTIGEDRAIEALRLGASDYVLKQRMERLVPAVRRALREAQEQARRQQAERALHENEAQLRLQSTALQSAANAISITNQDGLIQWVNPAFERLTGYTAAELIGQNHRLLKSGKQDAGFYKQMWDTILSGRVWHGELINKRKNGTLYTEEATITPVTGPGGSITNFVAIKQDITDRKRFEEALRQARDDLARNNADLERKVAERTAQLLEINANLQAFAYTAAHDLRSPLRSIKSFSSLVVEDYGTKLGPDGQSLLERVAGSTSQMEQLLNDLLEYSKLTQAELNLQPVNLRQAVAEALSLLDAEIRVNNAVLAVTEPLPEVLGHPATVVLLISNLVSNALKFIPQGVQPKSTFGLHFGKSKTRSRRSASQFPQPPTTRLP